MTIFRFFSTAMKEEPFDSVLGEQRAAKDAHDLHDWAVEFEVMLNDSDEAVGDDGHMNLDAHSVLGFSPECLDSKVLLDPFEKEFHLPSISIQKRNVFGREIEVVGVVGKCPLQFRSVVDDPPKLRRVVFSVILSGEADCLVSDNVVIAFEEVLSRDDLVFRMSLFTDDEKCSGLLDNEESCKVKVSSIKHIAGQWLVCEPVHGVDIVDSGISDSIENRYLCDDVDLGVDSDARICRPKLRPTEYRQAKIDGCGVDGVKSSVQFKLPDNTFLLGDTHHVERKLLEDAIVPNRVRFREHLPIDGKSSKSQEKRFVSMSSCDVSDFSQASASKKLTTHQNQQMVPMRETPSIRTIGIFQSQSLEVAFGKKPSNLHKNEMSCMHDGSNYVLNPKISISKVRQGFSDLNFCA